MTKLTDNCPMPFGPHKGTKMANVPDSFLKDFWETNKEVWIKNSPSLWTDGHDVMDYIRDYGPEHLKP